MPVTLTVDDVGVATLLLERPSKRNALDRAMLESLLARVGELAGRDDVRAVVVRGSGGTFCAGADIADWAGPTGPEAAALSRLGRQAFTALAALAVPSVALIEGTAVGGGLELALACDVRIARPDALIGFPELGLGNLPAWGGLARLIDSAGLGVARYLLLTGTLIDGVRAAQLQVVTSASDPQRPPHMDELLAEVLAGFLGSEPTALALAKQALSAYESDLPLEPALAAYFAGLDSSTGRKQAFLDRKAAAKAALAGAPAAG